MFDLIDSLGSFIGDLLEPCPDEEGASDMVTLDSSLAALALFDAAKLFNLSVQLLDLPTVGARYACIIRGAASLVVGDDMIRFAW